MSQKHFIKSSNNILSPPTTPKRSPEAYFYGISPNDKIMYETSDSYPGLVTSPSSQSPPYSPNLPTTSSIQSSPQSGECRPNVYIVQPLSFTTLANNSHHSAPLHRRKRKPSIPVHKITKGTFTMPLMPLLKHQKNLATLCNNDKALVSLSDQTRERKYKFMNCATKRKLLRLAKAEVNENVGDLSLMDSWDRKSSLINKCIPNIFQGKHYDQTILSSDYSCQDHVQFPSYSDPSGSKFSNKPPIQSNKAMRDTAQFYDNVAADSDIATIFKDKEDWIPRTDVFENRAGIRISWKGSPLKIQTMPHFEKLHPGEVPIAATLRLTPEQYLRCKYALILEAHRAAQANTLFRKSEAQKACCIDVNKASVLWKVFGKLGWLGSKWPK
ncbi:hypothetical protein G6F46_004908 [Rhizopus delemar]|uniref:SWIRM domain-containing protein n=3 Tax=Rhizopus TaxID=4842 RepID=I1C968_RHIO9|nr:hypothetical protein RO3G_09708 [Rhizopus delemar RA 99-880]KAG1461483.1 hypothetical protein G6F55_003535 [Rhizopus delemar]KAG1546104.1 hypothetical protein G6F51_005070 [Rhizopus arrhizus]KAG1499660.1 hypothetical protein G6F54_004258 [Rhizopus delemar]KAG1513405.1 hypothetical protein G6F53_004456 [Rhizopus delemar]|eukprot:EIE84998.1 hypothetical protein RO3G_09708 [Rhizopus delemar RA 99-880]